MSKLGRGGAFPIIQRRGVLSGGDGKAASFWVVANKDRWACD